MSLPEPSSVPAKIQAKHLDRQAIIYVRQSSMAQVRFNQESTLRQYALKEKAVSYGWPEERVTVIDEDLGVTGSGRADRPGYRKLVASVSLGEVGAVFGLEISRLARSSADLSKLLELCGIFGTLVIDEDGIYDMADINDRLLIGLKGTMGEAELHILYSRMVKGRENAAKRGELHFPLPVGYARDQDGNTIMDPDEQVRNAISLLFQKVTESGSAYGAVRFFGENKIQFPKRAYGGVWDGKISWGTLTHSRVISVLHNPAYAGVYAFGQYVDHKTADIDGHYKHHVKRQKDYHDWKVFIQNHHPAYISWEQYQANQELLEKNCTSQNLSGAAREGSALLSGIIYCGKCGRALSPRYSGNDGTRVIYECHGRWEHGNKALCSVVYAEVIDPLVIDKIMSVLQASEFDLLMDMLHNAKEQSEKTDKQWQLSIERARYEAERAERQYQLADPENRLVMRSLEANWEQKLKDLEVLQREYKESQRQKPWMPSPEEEQEIRDLQASIMEVWNAPTTMNSDKKRIIRSILEDVTVTCDKEERIYNVGIRFRSGKTAQLSAGMPRVIWERQRYDEEIIELVRQLAPKMSDQDIVEKLNSEGYKAPLNKSFTASGIRFMRFKYNIVGLYDLVKTGSFDDSITVSEASTLLGISKSRIYSEIKAGRLPFRQRYPNWPLEVLITDENLEGFRARYQSQ